MPVQDIEVHFRKLLEQENHNCRDEYDQFPSDARSPSTLTFTEDEIMEALKGISMHTAPGPDRVLLRPIKDLHCASVIAVIANIILCWSYLPKSLRVGRTILIHKGGDASDMKNFRPITIFSIIRRIIDRAVDKRIRAVASFSAIQRGFVSRPGAHINAATIDGILRLAKNEYRDLSIVFLDIARAFDSVGHDHIRSMISTLPLTLLLQSMVIELVTANETQVESKNGKTSTIKMRCGVPQGAPTSPTIFNLAIDHILKEIADPDLEKEFGFKIDDEVGHINILAFADDIVVIAKNPKAADFLVNLVSQRLAEIGLKLNCAKSKSILLDGGRIVDIDQSQQMNMSILHEIPRLAENEVIRYLGVNLNSEIVLDRPGTIQSMESSLNKIVSSPFLYPQQKLVMVNYFVWPSMIYMLQCAPIEKLGKQFLADLDSTFRATYRSIASLPNETPIDYFYTAKKMRGLECIRPTWEANLQHINMCHILMRADEPIINKMRNLQEEKSRCISNLFGELRNSVQHLTTTKMMRDRLRELSFDSWCALPSKGYGASHFQWNPGINKRIMNKDGLSSSQWTTAIKLATNSAPVRGRHAQSTTSSCRHCGKFETLAHVVGECRRGELLRNRRHNLICNILAARLRQDGYDVYQEISVPETNRRVDMVVINRTISPPCGWLLDPTVRMESSTNQPEEVNEEKKGIYVNCIPFLSHQYNIQEWKIQGLLFGARGTISNFTMASLKELGVSSQDLLEEIAYSALVSSIGIVNHHLYQ